MVDIYKIYTCSICKTEYKTLKDADECEDTCTNGCDHVFKYSTRNVYLSNTIECTKKCGKCCFSEKRTTEDRDINQTLSKIIYDDIK